MATYTQEQLDQLNEAIAQGARSVWYGDKRIDYRSLDDMIRIKNLMEAALGVKKGTGRNFADYRKGTGQQDHFTKRGPFGGF